MRIARKIFVLLISLFFVFTISLVADPSLNAESISDISIKGYVKDKNNNILENIDIYLINRNTSETLITFSSTNGFYVFDLSDLEKGYSFGDKLRIFTSYFDNVDKAYYYDNYFFDLNESVDVYWFNLTLNRTAPAPMVVRSMPFEVLPGSVFPVYMEARYYGGATVIWETIPKEFIYMGCNLSEENQDQYFPENHTIRFILYDEHLFSYNLTASLYGGEYFFDGAFIDFDKKTHMISGSTSLNVTIINLEVKLDRALIVERGNKEYFNAVITGGLKPFNISWDFNDDGVFDRNGQSVTYIFNKTGLYKTTIRVVDDNENIAQNTYYISCYDTKLVPPDVIPSEKDAIKKPEIILKYSEYVVIRKFTIDGKQINYNSSDNKNFTADVDLNEGDHYLIVEAADGAGNKNTVHVNFTFDISKPFVEIKNIKNNDIIEKKTNIIVNAYDNQTEVQKVQFRLFKDNKIISVFNSTGNPYFKWSLNPINYEEGDYILEVVGYDLAGNYNTRSITITVKHVSYQLVYVVIGVFIILLFSVFMVLYFKKQKK